MLDKIVRKFIIKRVHCDTINNLPTLGDLCKLGCACLSQKRSVEGEHLHKHIIAKFAKLGGYLGILVMTLWLVLPAAAAGDFTGTWGTVSSTGARHDMQLTQSGNTVSGTYSPQNGTVDGIVRGKVLNFNWTQAGGHAGTGSFELSADGNFFKGTWFHMTGSGEQTQGTWSGRRK